MTIRVTGKIPAGIYVVLFNMVGRSLFTSRHSKRLGRVIFQTSFEYDRIKSYNGYGTSN